MNVMEKSVYLIDYDTEKAIKKEVSEEFDAYILDLIAFIKSNKSAREFKTRSQTTEVVCNIKQVCKHSLANQKTDEFSFTIAQRLLHKEIDIQAEVLTKLGKKIRKGSLVQALIFDDEFEEYQYLVAKVEHSSFVDDSDFSTKSGFSSDQKKIWRTCIFNLINQEGEFVIDSARIFLNQKSGYWHKEFLEVDEMIDDEINTQRAFKAMELVLSRSIKKSSPSDYTVIRNTIIGYLRKPQLINYDEMVDNILLEYNSDSLNNHDIDNLYEKFKELPDAKNFDRQFIATPKTISTRIKRVYKVNEGIEIKIVDYVQELKDTIKSIQDEDGNRYIQIKTNNKVMFDEFN